MKEKGKNNTISFEAFIRLFVGVEILLLFLYTKYLATFSVYGNRVWIMILSVAVLAGGSLILCRKCERNWSSLLGGTLLPILVYEAICMGKYSLPIRIAGTVSGTIAVIVGMIWTSGKENRIPRVRSKRKMWMPKAIRASGIIGCFLLTGVCLYGKVLIATHQTVCYKDVAYNLSETYNGVPDYGNSLAANIETVAKIDPDGGWGLLSTEEKTAVLETIIRIECRYLGMRDSAPSLEIAHLEEGLLGEYDHERDEITLSYHYLVDSGSSGYAVVQVLCHELYHRYQRYQVNLLQAIRTSDDMAAYSSLRFLEQAEIYEEEFRSYISPEDGSSASYYQYRSQRLERDAEKYGNASVAGYYEEIRSYLDSD